MQLGNNMASHNHVIPQHRVVPTLLALKISVKGIQGLPPPVRTGVEAFLQKMKKSIPTHPTNEQTSQNGLPIFLLAQNTWLPASNQESPRHSSGDGCPSRLQVGVTSDTLSSLITAPLYRAPCAAGRVRWHRCPGARLHQSPPAHSQPAHSTAEMLPGGSIITR